MACKWMAETVLLTMLRSIIVIITIYYYITITSEIGNNQPDISLSVCLTEDMTCSAYSLA